MTVVLLDPLRPDMIPVGAARYFSGPVVVTEEVHPSLLWQLQSYALADAFEDVDPQATVITTDLKHPLVRQRILRGDTLVQGHRAPGEGLLEAVDLMDRLRRTGPWEQRQTHDSLRRYLLEEVYELLDAIDHGSQEDLLSELGDLLLQVLFHARIAEDSAVAPFGIDQVAASFVEKVTHRTPGVLSGEHADLDRQVDDWEAAKSAERGDRSVLDGVVTTQPALSLTQKLFERLAGVDFPVEAVSPVLYQVKVPFRKHARESVEDDQRRRAVALMDQVRAAEAAAEADGVVLRDEQLWRKYLGMSYEEPAAPSPAEPVEASGLPAEPTPPAEPSPPAEPVEASGGEDGNLIKAPAPASSLTDAPAETTSPIPRGRHSSPDSPDAKPSVEPTPHADYTPPVVADDDPSVLLVERTERVETAGDDDAEVLDIVETTTIAEVVDTPDGPAVEVTEVVETVTAEVVDADDTEDAPLADPSETKIFQVVSPASPSEPVSSSEPSSSSEPVEDSADADPVETPNAPAHSATMTVTHVESPAESDFPDVDDFPGPPPAKIHVNDDPILAEERAITVNYSNDVPGMVITESWSAKDDDE